MTSCQALSAWSWARRVAALAALSATAAAPPAFPAAGRPLQPADLFRLEELDEVALSPDGEWVAYVHRRPWSAASHHKLDFLRGNDRGDVWLAPVSSGEPRNLTHGARDGSGYWSPVWSPDGRDLALLSTRGGGNVRLWLWERSSGELRQLTERGVNLEWREPDFLWISDRVLVVPVLPEGARPTSMTVEVRAAEAAMREWPKAWAGEESTASVLESGVDATGAEPQGQLLLVDLDDGPKALATGRAFRELRRAPGGGHVWFLEQVGVFRPRAGQPIPAPNAERYRPGLLDARGRRLELDASSVGDVVVGSQRWSLDGSEIAFVAHRSEERGGPAVFRLAMATRAARTVTVEGLEPTDVAWSTTGELVVRGRAANDDHGERRADWWIVDEPQARNLTADMESVPARWVPEAGGSFVGVAGGEVWRLAADGSGVRSLTADFEPEVATIVWPSDWEDEVGGVPELIVAVERELGEDLHRIDLMAGTSSPVDKPSPDAALQLFHPPLDAAAFLADEPDGTRLWVSRPAFERIRPVVETNRFLGEISPGERRKIAYRSLDGEELEAWLILPPGYDGTAQVPLVTWVYAGSMARHEPGFLASVNRAHSLNLQLLAAHGYAVLLPSMPLSPTGSGSDPLLELPKGVLPAVDAAIDLGIADPERLGLMGQSYGGYSTYGLVTQTTRFQAAVALAGLSDLAALYGTFDARARYEPTAHERPFRMWLMESGQTRMGAPLWEDWGRYLKNSPIFYVDRVRTPLMIVQGDMDYVPIQQGEQFFSALYRQGKRARFVRYWGEGHVLSSPANVADFWRRVYEWFDEHLRAEDAESTRHEDADRDSGPAFAGLGGPMRR